jgi:predicted adenylyl cyclase CyaB
VKNIEIKARLTDRDAVEGRLRVIGAKHTWRRRQRDVFFRVAEGYLKLRVVADEPSELIAYQRAPGTEPRPSDYDIAQIEDGTVMERVLTRSLGVRGVVAKDRTLYLWHHTRIHLDEVDHLGSFLELETVAAEITLTEARTEAQRVIHALGLDSTLFLDRPYLELLESAGG